MADNSRHSAFYSIATLVVCMIPMLAFLSAAMWAFHDSHPIVGSFCLAFSLLTAPQYKCRN